MALVVGGQQAVSCTENRSQLQFPDSATASAISSVQQQGVDTSTSPSISPIKEDIIGRSGMAATSGSTATTSTTSTSHSSRTDRAVSWSNVDDRHSVGDEELIRSVSPTRMMLAPEAPSSPQPHPAWNQNSETHAADRTERVEISPFKVTPCGGEESDEGALMDSVVTGMAELKVAPMTAPDDANAVKQNNSVAFQESQSHTMLEFMADSATLDVPTSMQIHKARIPRSASKRQRMSEGGTLRRQVSFHQVQIRRYSMVAGDNPSCQMGVPVTLDWGFEELPALDLDDFEITRCQTRRRKLHHLLLNYFQRRRILAGVGYSEEEINQAEKEIRRERTERALTRMFLPIMKIEDVIQSVRRKVKRRVNKDVKAAEQELESSIRILRAQDAERLKILRSQNV